MKPQFLTAILVGIAMGWSATTSANAADNERYQIVPIKRDVSDGKANRTVNGTMMLDGLEGRSWILDEQKGRWIPVGYRAAKPSSDVTLIPKKLK